MTTRTLRRCSRRLEITVPAYPAKRFADIGQAPVPGATLVNCITASTGTAGIRFVTPEQRHAGLTRDILASAAPYMSRQTGQSGFAWRKRPTRNGDL